MSKNGHRRFVIQRRDTGQFVYHPGQFHNYHQWDWVDDIDDATIWSYDTLPPLYHVGRPVALEDFMNGSPIRIETRCKELNKHGLQRLGNIDNS